MSLIHHTYGYRVVFSPPSSFLPVSIRTALPLLLRRPASPQATSFLLLDAEAACCGLSARGSGPAGQHSPVAAIPAGFDNHAAPASRARLAGAILLNATTGEAWVCPPVEDTLGQNSKKLSISATGAYADAKDLSESQVQALNVSHYIPSVFGGDGADGAPGISHEVQGLLVSLQPIATQGGFDTHTHTHPTPIGHCGW